MWLILPLLQTALAAPSIPFEKIELENGLDVILAPDTSIPFVQVNVWYHVGSRNEVKGRTGFAHLFEHLMFQGSANAPGEYFDPLQRVGAQINGTTNIDRTNYFEGIPSHQLPLALFMESDRMGFLLPALDESKLSNQKDVVRNERRQRYENRPYGMAWPWLLEAAYPDGHPYHTATIGRHEDIEAATLEDVKAFFQTWYLPNNASLVISGDFDPRVVRPMVRDWFGDIPAGPAPAKQKVKPVKLKANVEVRKEADVPFPKVWMAWHTPAVLTPGDAELDLLSRALSDGKDSRLYKKLVRELQIAQGVEASQSSSYLQSLFIIEATAQPGHTSDELVAAIDGVLADMRKNPITADEMAVARTAFEVGFYDSIATIAGKANLLNNYNFLTGDPGYIEEDLARYQDASARNVHAVFKKYLGAARAVLHINPAPAATPANTSGAK